MRHSRYFGVLFVVMSLFAAGLPGVVQASPSDDPVTFFSETGHHVPDVFLNAWYDFGGLPILGYPITETMERDGRTVQYFERAIMEWHPEHEGTRYEVQLALLGNWRAEGMRGSQPFQPLIGPAGELPSNVAFFPETGHFLSNGFKDYWEEQGGLPLFGYPISEEFQEGEFIVQYFERARFEWHPELAGTDDEILLGHLGRDAASAYGVDTTAVAQLPDTPIWGQEPEPPPMPPPSGGGESLRIPALMYHGFGYPEARYVIGWERFAEQLDWLQWNGYTTVTVGQVYDYMEGIGGLPANPVILTFDDGPASHMDASYELDARGMVGVFYVNGTSALSEDDIRSLNARGHEIGAHSTSHPFLTQLSDGELWSQIYDNKLYLESVIGEPVDFFAYPFGDWDDRVAATVASAGYRGGIHAWGGTYWSLDKRWYQPRIEVGGTISLGDFIYYVEQF